MPFAHRHCSIVPPHILAHLAAHADDAQVARGALAALRHDHHGRRETPLLPQGTAHAAAAADDGTAPARTIGDAQGREITPGVTVRAEGDPATGDSAADEAYDGLGATWELLHAAYGRDSLDDAGLPLLATVHYGRDYDNAFWDGDQMVFGDGDGVIFNRFTIAVDVIGHELAHGVTEYTAGLIYRNQSGALNESISDVFGSLVKQRSLDQSVTEADWLIGAGLFTGRVNGLALRSMSNPGTAYDDPQIGKDPQPGHMDHYVTTSGDNGGVHINSGIPNRAFYLAATAIGGNAWEAAGAIWYAALTGERITASCDFATFAELTVEQAAAIYPDTGYADLVRRAWAEVGVLPPLDPPPPPDGGTITEPDSGTELGKGGPPPALGPVPSPDAEVTVSRTGGIAGLTRVAQVRLQDLPAAEAQQWQDVFARCELQVLADDTPGHPDQFHYRVRCPEVGLDVTFPEQATPEPVRDLLHRVLEA